MSSARWKLPLPAVAILLVVAAAPAEPAAPPATGPVASFEAAEGGLEFTRPAEVREVPLARPLGGVEALSAGGWFLLRRSGEQVLLSRGDGPHTAPGGERMFPRSERCVNLVLGTDHRGFLMATSNGNGSMPFPHVTIDEVPTGTWQQVVYVKDREGFQHFYRNGTLVHSDRRAAAAGKAWPFVEKDPPPGPPLRVGIPLGGLVGEAWVYGRALSAEEVARDFEAKRDRYRPAPRPAEVPALRTMDARFKPGLWKRPVTAASWPAERQRILAGARRVFGEPPAGTVPLDPRVIGEEVDCGAYVRRKVSFAVQEGDRMPAWLLVPKGLAGRAPAVICFYGTTGGAGKDTTVGLSGARPGSRPERNRAFAIDFAEAGFVVLAPDYLRDGERIAPGRRPYDTADFYAKFPDWSIHGKDAWDTSRAIDYLQSLELVAPDRIGMVGHSYGGHSTIFCAALDERIKACWANGPVSDFRGHGLHWAVPKGASNSQSLPAMRPFILDPALPIPVEFYELTALIAPRPLAVGQAAGERRPMEEENHAAVRQVYEALGATADRLWYVWYAGDHDFPPEARSAAVAWMSRWLRQ